MKTTEKDIIEAITIIKSNFPYSFKNISEKEIKVMIKTWAFIFQEESKEDFFVALFVCLENCVTPPTICDIKQAISKKKENSVLTDIEMWEILKKSLIVSRKEILKFSFTSPGQKDLNKTIGEEAREKVFNIYNRLPLILKKYVGDYLSFIKLAMQDTLNEINKAVFLREIKVLKDTVRQREEIRAIENKIKTKNNLNSIIFNGVIDGAKQTQKL